MIFCSILAALFSASSTHAQANFKGLTVTPVRNEVAARIGKVTRTSVRVTNNTNNPLTVVLSVQNFSASNYSYDHVFSTFGDNWVRPEEPSVELAPGEEKDMKFVIDVPQTVSPGGHYFALTASADMSSDGYERIAQVISLLFLSIDGEHVISGSINNEELPFVLFDDKLVYSYDASNTGNVHYNAEFFGRINGFLHESPESKFTHTLLPDTVRRVGGSVKMPFLPGYYTLTYGYKTDLSEDIVTKRAGIIYLPPWSIILTILILLSTKWLLQFRRSSKNRAINH